MLMGVGRCRFGTRACERQGGADSGTYAATLSREQCFRVWKWRIIEWTTTVMVS